ncbi:MAG: two-component regulator propeller domain-containing protein [Prolixibacteraceae bacterium]
MKKLLLAIFIFLYIFSFGNNIQYSILSFNTENQMLMHNSVETVVRDSMGYLWVGTNYGLNKLDGYLTHNYITQSDDSTSISNNHIKDLFVDSKNRLWIGSIGGGLNRYDYKNDCFIRYSPEKSSNSIQGFNISGIAEDKEGNLWLGITGKGISKFNPETEKFKLFGIELFQPNIHANSNIENIKCDSKGNIWIGFGYDQLGVYKIDVQTELISYMPFTNDRNPTSNIGQVTGIEEMQDGTMLFTVWNGGLYKYNPTYDSQICLVHKPDFFQNSHITCISLDQNQNIWVGTWEHGLYHLSKNLEFIENIRKNETNLNSLNSNAINYLYFENNQLWICYREQGIDLMSLDKKMFQNLNTIAVSKFRNIDAHCISGDANGNIWIGSRGQGLWKFNPKTEELLNFNSTNHPEILNNNILCITIDKKGIIWFGTDGSFIGFFDEKANHFKFINYHEDSWSSVYSIANNDSVLWCGSWGAGVIKVNKQTEKYKFYSFDNNDQYNNSVFDCHIVGEDLWLANIGLGLLKFNIPSEKMTNFRESDSPLQLKIKESINDIFLDLNNTLWLSTAGAGLIHYNPVNNTAETLGEENGLNNNVIQAVVADHKNNLWISTISGITFYDVSKKESTSFYSHNGLVINHLNKSAAYFDRNMNRIYIGSPKGLNYCNPDEIAINRHTNQVVINHLWINGEKIDIHRSKVTNGSLELCSTIRLKHEERNFTIGFSSMEFNPSFKSSYYYQLEGLNDNWTESSYSKNSVQYTNLDPGTYNFKVKACNNDGIFHPNDSSIQIVVLPAWWQTILFKILLVVVILSITAIIIYLRSRDLIRSKLKLESLVKKRTAEIFGQKEQIEHQKTELEVANRTKNTFFSILGHDLKNPLCTIDQFNELLLLEHGQISEETQLNYYKILKKTSTQTLQLLDDIIVWAKAQTNRIKINLRPIRIDDLFETSINQCESLALNKGIGILIPRKTQFIVSADLPSVQTIIRNLITNAIKFSDQGSKITIQAEEQENEIIIKISDQGVGMTKAQCNDLFKIEKIISRTGTKGEEGTGLGLILCKEFVQLNGGRIWVESEEGKGTTFFFTLKKV